MVQRADWPTYFMNIARQVATRSTCDRKQVGAVIVRDKTILSTGYNGSIRGLSHCDEDGHLMENGHCVRTVHAEANAIAQAARHGGEAFADQCRDFRVVISRFVQQCDQRDFQILGGPASDRSVHYACTLALLHQD